MKVMLLLNKFLLPQVWDTEMGGLKTEIVGNKAFFSLSYSEENRSLLATGADRSVRLYDPRATEGNLVTALKYLEPTIERSFQVKSVFTSHTGWCSAVQWASSRPNLFVSRSLKIDHVNIFQLPLSSALMTTW